MTPRPDGLDGRRDRAQPTGFNPISAALVLSQREATFTPFTTVRVWLEANLLSGTVLTEIRSNDTTVTFGGDVVDISLQYDPSTGTFERPAQQSGVGNKRVFTIFPANRGFLPG